MNDKNSDDLKKEYLALLNLPSVRAVLDWRIPNDDDAMDDELKAKEYKAHANSYAALTKRAMTHVQPGKDGQ